MNDSTPAQTRGVVLLDITGDGHGPVIVVEGQESFDAVKAAGYSAATWLGGAGIHRIVTGWESLAGKLITLWPGHDMIGRAAMLDLAPKLQKMGCSVSMVKVPDYMPERWNASQASKEEIIQLIRTANKEELDQLIGAELPRPNTRFYEIDPPQQKWTVTNWLPAGRVAILSGKGGTGKSKLAFMLACSLAAGRTDWLDTRRVPGSALLLPEGTRPVVYATWEQGIEEFSRWLESWPDGKQAAIPLLGDRFGPIDLARHGPVWQAPVLKEPGGLSATGRHLQECCEKMGAELLIMDSLAAAFSGNENSRTETRDFMAHWDGWARENNCTVLLIAHPAKAESGEASQYSGSTDWHAASRAVWTFGYEKNNSNPTLKLLKGNVGEPQDPVYLTDWKWWKATDDQGENPHD